MRKIHPSGWSPIWSPDGRRLAYELRAEARTSGVPPRIWVARSDGTGKREAGEGRLLDWSSEGTALLVLRDAPPAAKAPARVLLRHSSNGPEERELHRLPGDRVWEYELSPSRRWLALRQGESILLLSTRDGRQYRLPLPGLKSAYSAGEPEFHWGPGKDTLFYAKSTRPYNIEWREVRISLPTD